MHFHMRSVAYAATALAATMMHSVFMYYYVKVYLNMYHVSEGWFQFAQVIFMIWNAINDPLFGYVQDNYNFSWVKSRRHSIMYGAPLFALSFVLPWFPWGDYSTPNWLSGFQLLICLCFYDAMFTFVLLAQCALFAEMSTAQEDRVRLIRYSQVASLVGSTSVFFTGYFSSNLEHYGIFQFCCVIIGFCALLFLTYAGKHSHSQYDAIELHVDGKALKKKMSDITAHETAAPHAEYTMYQQVMQVLSSTDFVCFVIMNFCQVYHVNFLANFANVFCDIMISSDIMTSKQRGAFYGSLSIASQILVILSVTVVKRVGYYKLIRYSFTIKIFMAAWVLMFGDTWWGIASFFLLDSIAANATFSLFNLPLSDVIDVDKDKYKRKQPLSSMVFGTNALITKPAQSIAPMLTVAILNHYGYSSINVTPTELPVVSAELRTAMVNVCCATPLVLACVQMFVWSLYSIRNSHSTVAVHVES